MKKYFSVTTKCGHVGRLNCVWIDFAIYAESAKEFYQALADTKVSDDIVMRYITDNVLSEEEKMKVFNYIDFIIYTKKAGD